MVVLLVCHNQKLSKTGYCTIQKVITLKFCLEPSFFFFLKESWKSQSPIFCLQIALFVLYTMLIPSDHNFLGFSDDLHSWLVSLATLPLSSFVTCPLLTPKVRHSCGSVLTFFPPILSTLKVSLLQLVSLEITLWPLQSYSESVSNSTYSKFTYLG